MRKIQSQPEQVHTAVQIFGNTLRVAILRVLAQRQATRAEISQELEVTEQSLSNQIAMLESYGIVETTVLPGRGQRNRHTLNQEVLKEYEQAFLDYIHGKPEML